MIKVRSPMHLLYTMGYVCMAIYIAVVPAPPLTLKTTLAIIFFGFAGVTYLMGLNNEKATREDERNKVYDELGVLHGEDARRFHEYMNDSGEMNKNASQ